MHSALFIRLDMSPTPSQSSGIEGAVRERALSLIEREESDNSEILSLRSEDVLEQVEEGGYGSHRNYHKARSATSRDRSHKSRRHRPSTHNSRSHQSNNTDPEQSLFTKSLAFLTAIAITSLTLINCVDVRPSQTSDNDTRTRSTGRRSRPSHERRKRRNSARRPSRTGADRGGSGGGSRRQTTGSHHAHRTGEASRRRSPRR
jgi:hypothetical protein